MTHKLIGVALLGCWTYAMYVAWYLMSFAAVYVGGFVLTSPYTVHVTYVSKSRLYSRVEIKAQGELARGQIYGTPIRATITLTDNQGKSFTTFLHVVDASENQAELRDAKGNILAPDAYQASAYVDWLRSLGLAVINQQFQEEASELAKASLHAGWGPKPNAGPVPPNLRHLVPEQVQSDYGNPLLRSPRWIQWISISIACPLWLLGLWRLIIWTYRKPIPSTNRAE